MASITFKNLKNKEKSQDNFTYVDFNLDLQENLLDSSTNFVDKNNASRDIKVAYDLNAIRNSIKNIFSTIPGDRFLLPEFGANLLAYVFEPISDMAGNSIAHSIHDTIDTWEPRVNISNLTITGYKDRNEYEITILLSVPFSNESLNIKALLTREGISF